MVSSSIALVSMVSTSSLSSSSYAGDPKLDLRLKTGGVKGVAYIFHKLHLDKALTAKSIKDALEMSIADGQTNETTNISKDIQALLDKTMHHKDEGKIKVDADMSKCLRVLAEHASKLISTINQKTVSAEVRKRAQYILCREGPTSSSS
ncbi:hypothetical protein BGZ46_007253 [Entomortierella lignicola]|nr:hypothetical protein BGZ46_007253 [Entomortierella lignicola]